MIVVLINETVKKYLLKLSNEYRKRVREKFEFLETGIWDGGLKVKKLKGISSKYIFEARLDKTNRILFTLGQTKNHEGQSDLIVYVWGIAGHDHVSKKSKNIIPANVPFLQFRDYDEVLFEDIDMEELDPSYFTQENITEKIADESGSQRWYPVDEPEWKRIQLYTRDDFDLFLYLTPEQKEILHSPLPLMISGTAGSGKTTLSVYYLLNRNLNQKKKLFITYNDYLKKFAQRLYHGLLNEREWKNEVKVPDFYTFKELCLELVGGKRFPAENQVDFNRFNRLMAAWPGAQSFDPVLVWEEIRSVIKGAVPRVNLGVLETAAREIKKNTLHPALVRQLQHQFLLFSKLESLQAVDKLVHKYLNTDIQSFAAKIGTFLQSNDFKEKERVSAILDRTLQVVKKQEKDSGKYLSLFEYESLGKKKAPNFQMNRKEIYRIFEWYQAKLERENLWDEPDLTAEVGERGKTADYDILACDEIQDFTDTQLDVLFNLVKDPNNMFLAGDTKQIINPSGFRWEDVRQHFYERGLIVPGLKTLTLNFRSSGSIVEMSNILLELKAKLTGRKAEELKEEWKYKGRPVTVVSHIPGPGMLELLKTAGARRTILVRTETEKQELKNRLETELVFTINEAKGLEFDTVVLWRFCDDQTTGDVWKVILDMSARNIHEAKIKHEINLLYVGITRSQKDLIIYDGESPSLIWNSEQIRSYVYITDDRQFIGGVWDVVSTPGEWVEQGNYFFERGYFRAAAECFKNGGDEINLAKARAYYYEQIGNHKEAAVNFEKIDEIGKAARYYEAAREYKQALPLWEKLRNSGRALLCRAEVLKQEGNFPEAGKLYLEKKKYNDARECFLQAKNYRQLADLYLDHLKNIKEAAHYYELAREYNKAAGLYVRLKSYVNAAHLYELSENYSKAETCWKKVKNTKQLKDLYRKTGQEEKLFLIYEKEKDQDKAIKYLKSLNLDKERLKQEAGVLMQKGRYFPALVRYHATGDAYGIAAACFNLKRYQEAAKFYDAAGYRYYAGRVYYKIKEYEKAFLNYLESPEEKEDDYVLTRRAMNKIKNKDFLIDKGMDFYNKKNYKPAALIFFHVRDLPKLGICYAGLGDKQKAFYVWEKFGSIHEFGQIASECMGSGLIETGAEFFLTYMNMISPYKLLFASRYSRFIDNNREEKPSSVLDLMDTYFKDTPDMGKMRNWGEYIAQHDHGCSYMEKVLYYLEKTGQYNALIAYFYRYKLSFGEGIIDKKVDFEKELQELKAAGPDSQEALALRYFILGKTPELNQILPGLTLTRYNFCFYLWAEKDFRYKAYDYCVQHELSRSLVSTLNLVKKDTWLAEFFEYSGNLALAARHYEYAQQYRQAAGLYERVEKYSKAGDIYYGQGDYQKALVMYKKVKPLAHRELAKTYERLKDYEPALIHWKKANCYKDAKRCQRKIEKKNQKQQKKLPFPDI